MKNYLIISEDLINIEESIKDIVNKHKLSFDNITKFDFSENSLEDVIEELNTYSLFYNNKVVVLYATSLTSGEKKKQEISQNETLLEKYINNPNPDNILIIVTGKMDERKKINKLLRKEFVVIEKELSIKDIILKKIEDFKMNDYTIEYFIKYLNNNNLRIINELEKLKLYKMDEKVINIEDIDNIVVKEIDDDIFSLINCILKRNKKKALDIYKSLLSRGEENTKIVITVVDQFRLIYKAKILVNEGKSKETITQMFNIHPYRVKLAIETSYEFNTLELVNYIKQLGLIDINMKTGVSANNFGFDLFLLSL